MQFKCCLTCQIQIVEELFNIWVWALKITILILFWKPGKGLIN